MIGNRMCAFALSTAFAILYSAPPAIAAQFDGNWSMLAVTTRSNLLETKRRMRIGRLTTVGQVAAEPGRLYRQARRGDVAVADASRLATILAAMRQCLEASELERRIVEMEAALAVNTSTGSVLPFRKGMR